MTTWHQVKIHVVLVPFTNVKSDVVIAYVFIYINWPWHNVLFYQLIMRKAQLYEKKKKNEMICISWMTLFNKCHHRLFVYCLCHTASREKTVSSKRNTLYIFYIMNIKQECDGILRLFLSEKKRAISSLEYFWVCLLISHTILTSDDLFYSSKVPFYFPIVCSDINLNSNFVRFHSFIVESYKRPCYTIQFGIPM